MSIASNHPRNFCYQCKRPLAPGYRDKPWNIGSHEHHPMFDSQQCRDVAMRRHLHTVFEFTNLTNYVDDGEATGPLNQRDRGSDSEKGAQYDQFAEAEAFRDLAEEYRRFEKQYYHSPGSYPHTQETEGIENAGR